MDPVEAANVISPALGLILSISGAIAAAAGAIVFKIYKDKEDQTHQYNSAVLELNRQLLTSIADLKLELVKLGEVLGDLRESVDKLDDNAGDMFKVIAKDLDLVVTSCESITAVPLRRRVRTDEKNTPR